MRRTLLTAVAVTSLAMLSGCPAPTPTPPAADDTAVVNGDDGTQPEEASEGEAATTQ